MGTMDGFIDTVSASHPLLPLFGLLKSRGKLVMVGAPEKPLELPVIPLILGKYFISYYFVAWNMGLCAVNPTVGYKIYIEANLWLLDDREEDVGWKSYRRRKGNPRDD